MAWSIPPPCVPMNRSDLAHRVAISGLRTVWVRLAAQMVATQEATTSALELERPTRVVRSPSIIMSAMSAEFKLANVFVTLYLTDLELKA